VDIFRKPTTDTTINFTSKHPTEHKIAAYCYVINRMISVPLTAERRRREWQQILTIAENNKFPLHLITKLKTQIQHKTQTNKTDNKSKKWVTFPYHSLKVRKNTNLFKQTDIKIAFKSTNTIQQQTRPKNLDTTLDHNKSDTYKLTCKTCNKAYVRQTSRNLALRFRKHIRYIKKQ